MTLLTPCVFSSGYRPGWLDSKRTGYPPAAPRMRLRLLAAAVHCWGGRIQDGISPSGNPVPRGNLPRPERPCGSASSTPAPVRLALGAAVPSCSGLSLAVPCLTDLIVYTLIRADCLHFSSLQGGLDGRRHPRQARLPLARARAARIVAPLRRLCYTQSGKDNP